MPFSRASLFPPSLTDRLCLVPGSAIGRELGFDGQTQRQQGASAGAELGGGVSRGVELGKFSRGHAARTR